MTQIQQEQLKPCPFCGARPHVHDDASHSTAFFADCYNDNCTVQPSAYGLSKAEAIAAWNTRAAAAPDETLAQVRALIEAAKAASLALAEHEPYPLVSCQSLAAALRAIAEGRE